MDGSTDIFDIIRTTRAMRRLKPDPVPDELIRRIIEAGVCAPNGGNAQRWRFLVVKDPEIKRQIQVYYRRAFDEVRGPAHHASAPPPGMEKEGFDRQHKVVEHLTDHFHEVPVWIVPCMQDGHTLPRPHAAGASVYPAVQNMLLAARALGLGATLTTRHLFYQEETEALLGVPAGWKSFAILPIGWPMGRFGPVRRGPIDDIVYRDRWGQAYFDGTSI